VRKPGDLVKVGEIVDAIILGINLGEKRLSLGLKQALGDPWADAAQKLPVDSLVEGPVVSVQKFGAFVQVAEGVEGMIHVSDISAEKRINHPSDVFKVGQVVKAQVLAVDPEKRRLKLGIKQMVPTSIDEYLAERKVGDTVSGRVADVGSGFATIELGEGIRAICKLGVGTKGASAGQQSSGGADLKSLSSMLAAKWKSGTVTQAVSSELTAGQIRSFRVTKLDPAAKKIEVELA
jgi:small subunit ribosomal protein S1